MAGYFAIGMTVHNNAATIKDAVKSVLTQTGLKRQMKLIISFDNSTDESFAVVSAFLPDARIVILQTKLNSAFENRNFIHSHIYNHLPECDYICRLDADDELENEQVLSRVEAYFDETHFDVLLCSNRQKKDNKILDWVNKPDISLLVNAQLIQRLKELSEGNPKAEFPSCNTVFNAKLNVFYPEQNSAEDHWLLVELLLQKDWLNIQIAPELIYCIYSLNGSETSINLTEGNHKTSRIKLYEYVRQRMLHSERIMEALSILNKYKPTNYSYLGFGFSGVVFHDHSWVYKVHIPTASNNYNEIDHILYLKQKLDTFKERKHFYELREVTEVDGRYILIYPYEKSEQVDRLDRHEMIRFLTEMWNMKIICRSITKQNNFIRVNGTIKLIDYEIEPYNDNLFLNVVARAFIQLDEFEKCGQNYDKLKRSLINNLTLPELHGLWDFTKELFEQISFSNTGFIKPKLPTKSAKITVTTYDGFENPSVSLVIKACIQDSPTIYASVRHIVTQLPPTVRFKERVLLLDVYRSDNFLRQYNNSGNAAELHQEAIRLQNDGYIDSVIIAPTNESEIIRINKKWLGSDEASTHTFDKIPVTSQLFAFETINADYLLQMDCDVMIVSWDKNHDFLKEVISLFNKHVEIVTAGFQICQQPDRVFQEFSGFDSNMPVDPRNCLINKRRLETLLPLVNVCTPTGWKKSWYRALQQTQADKGAVSVRGGDTNTAYIHPQNFRKMNRKVWWTIQNAVEDGRIPTSQYGEPELRGNLFEWTTPKRNESFVAIVHLNEYNLQDWETTIRSIAAQDYADYGVIVINNSGIYESKKDIRQLIDNYFPERCTLIQTEQKLPSNEVIYDAIHYYMENDASFVGIIRQGDVLLSATLFGEVMNRLKLYDSDLLVGKEISEKYLAYCGISKVDFVHPRSENAMLDNGLQVFRKQLFDSLSHFDLKQKKKGLAHLPGIIKLKANYEWMDDNEGHSIMAPMTELAQNPIRFDHYNLLRTHTSVCEDTGKDIFEEIQTKLPKSEGDLVEGRKVFKPNQQKIELDITYDCNLKCVDCNRSCSQAPEKAGMTMEQINAFIRESIMLHKKWELINVLGGEPTLHPQFEAIVHTLLYDYIVPYSAETTLQITSNGFGEAVRQKLEALPVHPNLVIDVHSFKESAKVPYFTPFNLAPKDTGEFTDADYAKGCWVTSYCGIGLNHLGYFACGIAGAMERVMPTSYAKHSLTEVDDTMAEQLVYFCRYCGNFSAYHANRGDFMERAEKDAAPKGMISESWETIYKQWRKSKQL